MATRGAKQTSFSLKKDNLLLMQKLIRETEALKTAAALLIAAEDKARKLEATVEAQKQEIERLMVKNEDSANIPIQTGVEAEALKIAADLLLAAEEKARKLETTVVAQEEEIERLQVKIDASANITIHPAEAAKKIRELEENIYEKTTYIIRLKNKLTTCRLKRDPNLRLRPNCNILADIEY